MSAISTKPTTSAVEAGSPTEADAESPVRPQGPFDTAAVEDVVTATMALPTMPGKRDTVLRIRRCAIVLLRRLEDEPGQTWQERWEALEARFDDKWGSAMADDLSQGLRSDGSRATDRSFFASAIGRFIQLRLIRPSYSFLREFKGSTLCAGVRSLRSPESFERAAELGRAHGMAPRHITYAFRTLTVIVIHTGKELHELTATDLLDYRERTPMADRANRPGLHGAWQILVLLGQIQAGTTLSSASKRGQLSTAELVDKQQVKSPSVRQVLIRYLDELRPGMDYNTFFKHASILSKNFWADIERHHPGIDSLDLPDEVTAAWKERTRYVIRQGRKTPRKTYFDVLMKVRAFYLDIAEWALEDPSWAPWAAPCPIRRGETDGQVKLRKATKAEIHQRIRDRLPHLPKMVDTAEAWKNETAALLAAVSRVAIDEEFEHDGRRYRRTVNKLKRERPAWRSHDRIQAVDLATGEIIKVDQLEDQAFWAWACVETLRHTGIRIEELLELTHLALVSYRLPDTGEIVPLLQIVPSKSNEERLLLVTPELASVLASIVQRLRQPDGTIPLVARYDQHERITGPELPHLFQRRFSWKRQVISAGAAANLLTEVLERSGLTDRTGQPLHCTPHDFRRMFSTEAVTGGLPVHIAAKILGHANINTTEGYTAVFQDDLIRSYRAFIDRRRADRPSEEYREPTAEEWIEFQQHFALRKLELGDCGRPYGTPCAHEHACVRCPMLRVDPRAKGRLQEIIANLTERIEEARANGWLGEIEGLKTSQTAAIAKLASLNRAERNKPGFIKLDMPSIRRSQ